MHPTLFRFGVFEITSYSVMLGLSFAAGGIVAGRRSNSRGIAALHIAHLSTYMFLAAIAGARLAYAVVNYREFTHNLFAIYQNGAVGLGGMVMNGGVLCALLTVWAFAAFHKLPVLKIMDVIAPSFAFGIFLTRLGCFLNGCCYGRATDLPWGVIFPAHSPAGFHQRMDPSALTPVHPAQLYAALSGLVILAASLVFDRRKDRDDGGTALFVLTSYAVARFVEEFFRYNNDHVGRYLGLTHNQCVSIFFILAGATAAAYVGTRDRQASLDFKM